MGGKNYMLKQFHFHRPSEEKINGKGFEMTVHLVHADQEGKGQDDGEAAGTSPGRTPIGREEKQQHEAEQSHGQEQPQGNAAAPAPHIPGR